ncbi:nucleotidyltransferase [Corynebacterium sp. CCM 8835]|uniref:Nucleotidyltransferase n=1 Tax=Corynebacterium antarcticum TaxID=2800405 RepID=A0ABS1FMC6_9CORY|nr:putative nucleotidyltransferase substrate binding domain-containing protein [Corynebacterium antarcticum]MCK7642785.1 nucleotidyltransferase [Corynebacterium antarcticum]MCK7661271.1 nucleotidyltransferase [Corynebacterium antarcticum]MCL0246023.1 nucleotidyltransferase [Corynebacterium antarcticum]MCX7540596.1 nucleotidyltransferase [Corynebacterium antarcticum]
MSRKILEHTTIPEDDTVLHDSLTDLAEQAPLCASAATVRGVLTESHDLLRNALNHSADVLEVTRWYTTLVTDALHSPGAVSLTRGAEIVITGPYSRGSGTPTAKLHWLTVLPSDVENTTGDPSTELAALVSESGILLGHLPGPMGPADRSTWSARIDSAVGTGDGAALGLLADAGDWFTRAVIERCRDFTPLLAEAVEHRPPAVRSREGLPRKDVAIDVQGQLLTPLGQIARWAGVAAGCTQTGVPERIGAARAAGVLLPSEADYLLEAWEAGLELTLTRWLERVQDEPTTLDMLPQLQRSTFGAACRMLADVTRSTAERHGVDTGEYGRDA